MNSNRKDNITVSFLGEKVELESALVSGYSADTARSPFSVYAGPLDLDCIHTALFFANRTVIKLLVDEFDIPLDHNLDEFLISATAEAITKEYNERRNGQSSVEIQKIVKQFRKNQN
jgi:hypothetical protein